MEGKDSGHILLDGRSKKDVLQKISNLHVWQIGENVRAAIISLVTHYPRPVEHYRELLEPVHELRHITIEVNICTETPCQ